MLEGHNWNNDWHETVEYSRKWLSTVPLCP